MGGDDLDSAMRITTNDHHLLALDQYWEVRIVRPGEFAELTKLAITSEGDLPH